MRNSTSSIPYLRDIFTVKQYGDHIAKITYHSALRAPGWEAEQKKSRKGSVNSEKLENNLCRAKNTVRELVLCNSWDYWCTFTLSPDKHNRYDLEAFVRNFGEFIHNYNRRHPGHKVLYVVVVEIHKDGAYHMHGFIKGISPKDLYKNQYGYLTWKQYEKKFGFVSMDPVRDKDRASSYILKYMTKETLRVVQKMNAHVFYASKGLARAEKLYCGSGEFFGKWDWEHPDGYCKVKTVDLRKEKIENYFRAHPLKPTASRNDAPVLPKPLPVPDADFVPCYDLETGEIFPSPFDEMELCYDCARSVRQLHTLPPSG